jgi:Ni,Fe-hydrogenase maturation factor
MERIHTVEHENLQRLAEDIAILTKYLKTQNVPRAAVDALEGLSRKQQESWDTALERIEKLLEE